MIKQTIKYLDIMTNEQVEGDFYFHLNKAEVLRIMAVLVNKIGKNMYVQFLTVVIQIVFLTCLNLLYMMLLANVHQMVYLLNLRISVMHLLLLKHMENSSLNSLQNRFRSKFLDSIVAEGKPANAKTNQQMKALATGGKQNVTNAIITNVVVDCGGNGMLRIDSTNMVSTSMKN